MRALGIFLGGASFPTATVPTMPSAPRAGRSKGCWRSSLLVACCILTVWHAAAKAAEASVGDVEYAVKAAYLYKFAGYVEWPPTSFSQVTAPLKIGVVGADRLVAELTRQLAGVSVSNHPVTVASLKPGDALGDVQILFIGRQENSGLPRLLAGVQQKPVLTVTELADGLDEGSVINFVTTDNRIRFEISLPAAQKSGLKLSSRLLSVAQQVQTVTP